MQTVEIIILFEISIYLYLGYFYYLRPCEKLGLYFNDTDSCVYNGDELILKLRYNSTNYKFVSYLFNNIGREITEKELEDNVFCRPVYINKLVSNINLPPEIRDKTFNIRGGKVIFDPSGIKKPIKNK
ncbi:hypothetical protein [Photobacterium leiognathi]|uniref:hypothetical protein n=1 Tax=Photobacterium leiognathi TaxID=553611 RepID=UPI0027391B45|nr:hypothetical protein [Photobacterium leiognathi]